MGLANAAILVRFCLVVHDESDPEPRQTARDTGGYRQDGDDPPRIGEENIQSVGSRACP